MLTLGDSTGNGFDGVDAGTTVATGPVSYTRLFDPNGGDFVDTTLSEHLPVFTVECLTSGDWPGPTGPSGVLMKERNFQMAWDHSDPFLRGALSMRQGGIWYDASFGTLADDVWYYLAGSYDGETLTAYSNGFLIDLNPTPSGPPDVEDFGTVSAKIGRHAYNNFVPDSFYTGSIDEVRISSVPRTPGWIAATAQSMNDGLVQFGAEELLGD
jgi:hypothetical protein